MYTWDEAAPAQTEAVGNQEQLACPGVSAAGPQAVEDTWPAQRRTQPAEDANVLLPPLLDALKVAGDAQIALEVQGCDEVQRLPDNRVAQGTREGVPVLVLGRQVVRVHGGSPYSSAGRTSGDQANRYIQ
jgi:hypothetical protein